MSRLVAIFVSFAALLQLPTKRWIQSLVVEGWSLPPFDRQQCISRRRALESFTSAVLFAPVIQPAVATSTPDKQQLQNDLLSSLSPATPEQPQIPLTTSLKMASLQSVQGLIYLKNPKQRPRPSDTILISVRTRSDASGPVLAAARIPLNTSVQLPIRFQMSIKNAADNKVDDWKRALLEEDLWVQATVVCSADSINDDSSFCSNGPTFQAIGLAKLLRLDDGSVLRAPVSLPLQ